MNKYPKTLFRIILAHTIVLSSTLYINGIPYYYFIATVLGLFLGWLLFTLIPMHKLNEWFFYKNMTIKYFIFMILAGSVLGTWPIILELYTEIDITDSNALFLNITLLTICVLKLIREIYDKLK